MTWPCFDLTMSNFTKLGNQKSYSDAEKNAFDSYFNLPSLMCSQIWPNINGLTSMQRAKTLKTGVWEKMIFCNTFWLNEGTTFFKGYLIKEDYFRCCSTPRNSCSMAEFRLECLTYAHSRARPVLFATSPSCGLPPTATIPARMLTNIKRPSRLESGLL